MKKRRQHYVWRRYLRAWAENDIIWCYRAKKIFSSNLMGVGQIRDFYKLKRLTEYDIEFIRKLALEPTIAPLKSLNEGWIKIFTTLYELEKVLASWGDIPPEVIDLLDEQYNNLEEDYHAQIESIGDKYLDLLLAGDSSFYASEKDCIPFFYFLCLQYMRTNKMQENMCIVLKKAKDVNEEAVWSILRHIYATNIAWTLFAQRSKFRIVFVRNTSCTPFITCDQPIINTYAAALADGEIPTELEFYYPLSPCLAILISEKDIYKTNNEIPIIKAQVEIFNDMIFKSSHEQIYASNKDILEIYSQNEAF